MDQLTEEEIAEFREIFNLGKFNQKGDFLSSPT
jgi:hypothetical protein